MAWTGYFEFDGNEIINASRTEAYAKAFNLSWFRSVYNNTDLRLVLAESAYVTPVADDAPWYDPTFPVSADFLGAYPVSVDGVENSTVTAQTLESISDGGVITAARKATKTVVFSVVLVAVSEAGAEYGLQWLKAALDDGGCGTDPSCAGYNLDYFASEPHIGAWDTYCHSRVTAPSTAVGSREFFGRALHRARMTVGPTVTSKWKTSGQGAVWPVTFTLAAGSPYEFSPQVDLIDNFVTTSAFSNPGFEVNTAGWSTAASFNSASGATLTRITSDADTGVASGQVVTTAASSFQGIWTDVAVAANTMVTVTSRVKVTGVAGAQMRLRDVSNDISQDVGGVLTANPGAGWTTLLATITTGPLPATVRVSVTDYAAVITTFLVDTLMIGSDPYVGGVPSGGSFVTTPYTYTEPACVPESFVPVYDPLSPAVTPPPQPPGIIWGGTTLPATWQRRRFVIPAQYVPGWTEVAPIISVTAPATDPALPDDIRNMRIRIYSDPDATGNMPAEEECEPCGDFLIRYIPDTSTLVIDAADQVVYVESTAGTRRRGDALVSSTSGAPFEWPSLSCGIAYVVTVDMPAGLAIPSLALSLVGKVA